MHNKLDPTLERLVEELKQLPGIGEKTALRLSYFILRQSEEFAENLAGSILSARQQLTMCAACCTFSETTLCGICGNPQRSDEIICVVEEPSDIAAFEKSRQFSGKYHVLHGVISPLDGLDESRLKIKQLQSRLAEGAAREVILATNPTVEGDATALYLARMLKRPEIKISRIAHGIPVGAEIEYLDGATLGKALQNRVSL